MKTMRESFEANYMAIDVPANNKKGFKIKYRYVGNWYVFGENADQLKKTKRYVGNLSFTSLILYLAAGMQNSPLNYSRYIELFAMLSLAAYVFEAVGTIQFCFSGAKVTNSTFNDIRVRLTASPAIFGILLMTASVTGVVQTVTGGLDYSAFLIPLCYFLSGFVSLMITYIFTKLPYHIEKESGSGGI